MFKTPTNYMVKYEDVTSDKTRTQSLPSNILTRVASEIP